eukprot:CAMPEP_0177605490 /NCGR_PEP_ID=MMETSP0419_2-20121207/16731_1 /TAXON_ID=582737 /ORGANISM="Tetraselmis sp., Strain GSL018" /LENGTH=289 /DNA_ID=CAMNT_0019099647 /DNA_START=62 /DNA_END=927 /DNA_ORIENTATION=-
MTDQTATIELMLLLLFFCLLFQTTALVWMWARFVWHVLGASLLSWLSSKRASLRPATGKCMPCCQTERLGAENGREAADLPQLKGELSERLRPGPREGPDGESSASPRSPISGLSPTKGQPASLSSPDNDAGWPFLGYTPTADQRMPLHKITPVVLGPERRNGDSSGEETLADASGYDSRRQDSAKRLQHEASPESPTGWDAPGRDEGSSEGSSDALVGSTARRARRISRLVLVSSSEDESLREDPFCFDPDSSPVRGVASRAVQGRPWKTPPRPAPPTGGDRRPLTPL